MKKLYNILESIILEGVAVDKVTDAINNGYVVEITYDDGSGSGGKGPRKILPVLLGTTKGGNQAIRAFQAKGGDTKTKAFSWKIFLVNGITSWAPTKMRFHPGTFTNDPKIADYVGNADKDFVNVTAHFDASSKMSQIPREEPTQDVEEPTEELDNANI